MKLKTFNSHRSSLEELWILPFCLSQIFGLKLFCTFKFCQQQQQKMATAGKYFILKELWHLGNKLNKP